MDWLVADLMLGHRLSASASASSEGAASGGAARPSGRRCTTTTAARAAAHRGGPSATYWRAPTDARPHGHHLGQLPAYAGDPSRLGGGRS